MIIITLLVTYEFYMMHRLTYITRIHFSIKYVTIALNSIFFMASIIPLWLDSIFYVERYSRELSNDYRIRSILKIEKIEMFSSLLIIFLHVLPVVLVFQLYMERLLNNFLIMWSFHMVLVGECASMKFCTNMLGHVEYFEILNHKIEIMYSRRHSVDKIEIKEAMKVLSKLHDNVDIFKTAHAFPVIIVYNTDFTRYI